ncbi:MAG TPA: hypothetical protein VNQ76_13170 [Planctomicrobium sp.]|nr:hypothetical protein [Planctomicrobium sp.]
MVWCRTLAAGLLLLSGGILSAGEPLPELVRQLGHASFQKRIAAEQEILSRGADGLRLTSVGSRSNDPEIRQRSQRLLTILQKRAFVEQRERVKSDPWTVSPELAPGWENYQELVGDGLAAREIYVRMIEHEPGLMMALVLQPDDWMYELDRRCADLRTFFDRRYTQELNQATVVTLLFLSILPDSRLSPVTSGTVASLITEGEFRNTVQRAPEDEQAIYHALLSCWIEKSGNSSPASRMQLAGQFQLSAGVVPAREIVANRKAMGQSRAQLQQAIGFLARYGDLSDVSDLEKLLDQERLMALNIDPPVPFDPMELKATEEKSALRPTGKNDNEQQDLVINDLALRALVILTGQDPRDYGFPAQRGDSDRRGISNSPGFTNESERQKSLARWLSWRTEHSNRLIQTIPDASEGTAL